MKKIFGFVVVMFFMSWSQAFADYSYSFSFISNDKSLHASGTLTTASDGAGPLTVTGGFIDGSFGYATLWTESVSSGYLTSKSGRFLYDNQLSPGSSQWLTLYGLLFTTGAYGSPDYKEINLWGNSTAKNDYSLVEWTQATGYSDYTSLGSKGTATVPIPGAILLFAPGLAGIALLRRRNKQ